MVNIFSSIAYLYRVIMKRIYRYFMFSGRNIEGSPHLRARVYRACPTQLSGPSGLSHPCRDTCTVRTTTIWTIHNTMDRISRLLSCVLLLLLPLAAALKFDLHPVSPHDAAKYERCVRNFCAKDQLVVVTAILDGYRGDGQRVDMHVRHNSIHLHLHPGANKSY